MEEGEFDEGEFEETIKEMITAGLLRARIEASGETSVRLSSEGKEAAKKMNFTDEEKEEARKSVEEIKLRRHMEEIGIFCSDEKNFYITNEFFDRIKFHYCILRQEDHPDLEDDLVSCAVMLAINENDEVETKKEIVDRTMIVNKILWYNDMVETVMGVRKLKDV